MRVTFVSPAPDMSGGARVIAIHAGELARMGHEVLVVAPPSRPPTFRENIRKLRRSLGRRWRSDPRAQPAAGGSHFDNVKFAFRILDEVRPIRDDDLPDADVVVATWWETAEWVKSLHPSKGAKVYFIQGHETFDYLPAGRTRATYKFPMHKIVVSQWLRSIMEDFYGDRVVDVVPNSVDREQFHAPERGKQHVPTIGFLYSSGAMKGLDLTLAALQIIRQQMPVARLVCLGSHLPHASLPLLTDTLFYYRPDQGRISEVYSQCDVWVTASRSEGFNLTAMEAAACRTPVISTKTGWPLEALEDGKAGILVDQENVDEIAKALFSVLSLKDQDWRMMSQSAYGLVSGSSWANSATMFERALLKACERASKGEIAGGKVGGSV